MSSMLEIVVCPASFPLQTRLSSSRLNCYVAPARLAMLLAIGAACALPAQAQATFNGAQRTLGSGFDKPHGVAVDASGNIFIADTGNNAVKEVLSAGGYTGVKTLGSGFNGPYAVAVDASGNVYVADTGNNAIKEILAVAGSIPASNPTIMTLGSGFNSPTGVAVDAGGNVFIADLGNQAVKEIFKFNGIIRTLADVNGGLVAPDSVAVDANDNVFFTDLGNNPPAEVKEISAGTGIIRAVGNGFNNPVGVAVDPNGNVFVADIGSAVYEILAVDGSVPASNPTILTLNSGSSHPQGVAVDASGNVFIADSGNNRVVELSLASVNFGLQAVAAPSAAYSLFFTVASDAPTNLASVAVLTTGASGKDFVAAGSSTCLPGIHSAATICQLNVIFKPLAPGLRRGAAVFTDSTGNVLASVPLYGVGSGPQVTYQPGAQSPLGGTVGFASGVAVDGNGNVFVAGGFNNAVVEEILAVNGSIPPNPTVNFLGGRFSFGDPTGLAVDGSGNVFVADQLNRTGVEEILAAGGYTTVNVVGAGFDFGAPEGVALDGAGNVFVADRGDGAVDEILAAGGYTTVRVLESGFAGPTSLAVDADGNVFVGVPGIGAVMEILAVNGSIPFDPTINLLSGGPYAPAAVAVDPSGNVFVTAAGTVKEILAARGYTTAETVGSGFDNLGGITIDGSGNLYVANGSSGVVKLNFANPPSIKFPTPTLVGSTDSADGPKVVNVWNTGNEPLVFSAPSTGGNPSYPANFPESGDSGLCGAGTRLAPGTSCGVSMNFAPTVSGVNTGKIVLTDNALNGNPAIQSIALSGTGATVIPRVSVVSPNYGAPAALIAITGTDFGATQSSVTVGGAPSHIVSWSNTAITIQVPSKAATGNIIVTAGGVASNGVAFTFYSYPAITGISPTSGPAETPVTITGAGLLDGGGNGAVTFNGIPATILAHSATSIQVQVPAKATTGLISVYANGDTVKSSTNFTVIEILPQISLISPNYGAPAALIAITGTNFGATQGSVAVGGAPSHIVSWSNTAIAIQVPSKATTGNIIVTAGGVASNGVAFTFYPYPAITGISPTSGPAETPVTITGAGLLDGGGNGAVTFNGIPATILAHSATNIQVQVPAKATTGLIAVQANGDTVKSSANFTVIENLPRISVVSPNYGAPAALIAITGTNFGVTQGGVTVGGALSHIVSWSNAAIVIQVPSKATTGNIIVTAGGAASSGVAFTFYSYPAITAVSPASGSAGTPVTITGTGLLDGGGNGAVTFNGIPATILAHSATNIQVQVPAKATTGLISVHVNGDTVKSSSNFNVTEILPKISVISPNYGAPAALIAITGTDFGATQGSVTVGGTLSHIVSWSNTAIVIQVPSKATTGNIIVTTGGVASSGVAFTFYSYPAITAVSPASGPAGTPVTITGAGLLDGGGHGAVTFNGIPATLLAHSATSILVDVPAGATTGLISVHANGDTVKSSSNFTVTPPPEAENAVNPLPPPISDLTHSFRTR